MPKILASPHSFKQYGQSGATISNLLPGLQSIANEVTFIKSMHTTQFNHSPAQIYLSTGFQIPGRPSFGSWLTYGIGSDSKDLPAFVVLLSGSSQPDGGTACWSSGFLPTVHQGVPFRKQGDVGEKAMDQEFNARAFPAGPWRGPGRLYNCRSARTSRD